MIGQYISEGVLADTERTWGWEGREWGIYLHYTENMVRNCYIEEGGEIIDLNGKQKKKTIGSLKTFWS